MSYLDWDLLPSCSPTDTSQVLLCDGQGPMMCASNNRLNTTMDARTKNSNDAFARDSTKLLNLTPVDESDQKKCEVSGDIDIDKLLFGGLECLPLQSEDGAAVKIESDGAMPNIDIEDFLTLTVVAPEEAPLKVPPEVPPDAFPTNDYQVTSQTFCPPVPVVQQNPVQSVQPVPGDLQSSQLGSVVIKEDKTTLEGLQFLGDGFPSNDDSLIYAFSSIPPTCDVLPTIAGTSATSVSSPVPAPVRSSGIHTQVPRPIAPKGPSSKGGRRRGREAKVPLYKRPVLEDKEAEKKRQNACNARKNRERKKEEENNLRQRLAETQEENEQLRAELERLRSANTDMESKLEAVHRALMSNE